MVPTLSASGSVGEGVSGGERRREERLWPCAAIQGRVWATRAAGYRKTRTSKAKWAACMAKNRRDDAQRSPGWFVISYFSNVKQLTREREKCWHHCECSHHFLPPQFSDCATNKAEKSNTVSCIPYCILFGNHDHTGSRAVEAWVIASPFRCSLVLP